MNKGQGQFILVTPTGYSNPIAIPVTRLFAIYQNDAATETYLRFHGVKEPMLVDETITAIFNQQAVTGNNLNMLKVTNDQSGRVAIYFTQHIKTIVEYNSGANTKIKFEKSTHDNIITTENIATIYAMQNTNKNLGMVLVTGKEDGVKRIFMTSDIKSVYSYPDDAGPVTGSIISFGTDRIVVDETPTSIYTNQPK